MMGGYMINMILLPPLIGDDGIYENFASNNSSVRANNATLLYQIAEAQIYHNTPQQLYE
ncbi:Uncharacterised protein [Serratia fonticola]|nr:Uncharacterised protein [Serratia fonticola]